MSRLKIIFLSIIAILAITYGALYFTPSLYYKVAEKTSHIAESILPNFNASKINKVIEDPPSWVQATITKQLKPFEEGIKLSKFPSSFGENQTHVVILDNKIYYTPVPDHSIVRLRIKRFLTFLHKVSKTVALPDTDFILSAEDCFCMNGADISFPIFTFCRINGSKGYDKNILIPDDRHLKSWFKIKTFLDFIKGYKNFKEKEPKIFWLGDPRTNSLREKLISMAEKATYLQALSSVTQKKFIPVSAQIDTKYNITLDGFCATWPGVAWRLNVDALLIRPVTNHEQWFYEGLKPGVHFAEVDPSLENLKDVYNYYEQHPQEAEKIIRNAHNFVENNLTKDAISAYILLLLRQYSKLLEGEIKVHEGMQLFA